MPVPPQFAQYQASKNGTPGAAATPGKPGAAKPKKRLRLKAKPTKGKVPPQFARKGAEPANEKTDRETAMDVLKEKAQQAAGGRY